MKHLDLEEHLKFTMFNEVSYCKDFIRKQAEEIEYWKSAFERAMTLYDQVKHLEAQVYGGTTK